jgi:hypothetical protein
MYFQEAMTEMDSFEELVDDTSFNMSLAEVPESEIVRGGDY